MQFKGSSREAAVSLPSRVSPVPEAAMGPTLELALGKQGGQGLLGKMDGQQIEEWKGLGSLPPTAAPLSIKHL